MKKINLAISTCPNDTFAFHAILNRRIDLEGLEFDIQLLDIQQLNDGLFSGDFDVAKASFHAALLLADETMVLPSGSALGFGVGPLLLAARESTQPDRPVSESTSRLGLTLCPGQYTTAALLFRLFYGSDCPVDHVVFSEIMPRLIQQSAEFGVCIHEGRFTWESQGLYLVEDLGTRWENETKSPLPLGGILIRRNVPTPISQKVQSVIRRSIEYALVHRDETVTTMRQYAQEFDDAVLFQHVDLYVNQWTVDLGIEGRRALAKLGEMAQQRNIVPTLSSLDIFEPQN